LTYRFFLPPCCFVIFTFSPRSTCLVRTSFISHTSRPPPPTTRNAGFSRLVPLESFQGTPSLCACFFANSHYTLRLILRLIGLWHEKHFSRVPFSSHLPFLFFLFFLLSIPPFPDLKTPIFPPLPTINPFPLVDTLSPPIKEKNFLDHLQVGHVPVADETWLSLYFLSFMHPRVSPHPF